MEKITKEMTDSFNKIKHIAVLAKSAVETDITEETIDAIHYAVLELDEAVKVLSVQCNNFVTTYFKNRETAYKRERAE
jgi:hypothetical protein